MSIRIGINGFGRIGRLVYRAALQHPEIEVVAVNASYPPETLLHMLRFDTIHGRFDAEMSVLPEGKGFRVNQSNVALSAERNPANIPWEKLEVDIVVEATGAFRTREAAEAHLQAGAAKVILTAPAKSKDVTTIVMGVNESDYDPERDHVVSNASCTTNCLAPVAKVLHENFGIVSGFMTTVHSYTNDQRTVDNPHKDLRRARTAAANIIPTTTGAAKAIGLVLPELAGRLDGISLRVPTPNVSIVDLSVMLEAKPDAESINNALRNAAKGELEGILDYNELPLVSSDYVSDPHSSIVDGLSTSVLPGGMSKVLAWYDNEMGYAHRVVDLAAMVGRSLPGGSR